MYFTIHWHKVLQKQQLLSGHCLAPSFDFKGYLAFQGVKIENCKIETREKNPLFCFLFEINRRQGQGALHHAVTWSAAQAETEFSCLTPERLNTP